MDLVLSGPYNKLRRSYSNQTKVLLCQAWQNSDEGQIYAKKYMKHRVNQPNYGLVLLATLAEKAGYTVEMFDAESELVMYGKGDPDYIIEKRIPDLVSNFQPDIVGISCISDSWPETYRMAEAFHRERETKKNNFKLILGGFHPTSQLEDVFRQAPFVDWIHVGESERSFLSILEGKNFKDIPGIAWQEGNKIFSTPPESIELDSLPFPDWNWLDFSYYFNYSEAFNPKAFRFAPLLCSRGCIYRCAFCTYKYQKYQRHSPEYVGDYIEYVLKNYKVDALYPYDSFLSGEYLHQICDVMIKREINKKVTWGCALRANTTEKKDLQILKKANCFMVFYGFESGSNRMLIKMNKMISIEDSLRVAQYHHELRLPFLALLIFGYPGERLEDVRLTQQFLIKSPPYYFAITLFNPMPGSAIFDELKKEGEIHITDPYSYRKHRFYLRLGHVNYTEMDGETFELAYRRLYRTGEEICRNTRRRWALLEFSDKFSLNSSDKFGPGVNSRTTLDPQKLIRLKAYIIHKSIDSSCLEKIGCEDHAVKFFLSPKLALAADLMLNLERLQYKYKDNPFLKTFLNEFQTFALLTILYIFIHLPRALFKRLRAILTL